MQHIGVRLCLSQETPVEKCMPSLVLYHSLPTPFKWQQRPALCDGKEVFTACIPGYILNFPPSDVLAVLFVSSLTTTDSLTISWALADGLTATTDYIISYLNTDCPSDTYNEITDIHPSEMMYTLTGLEEGTDYSIMVTASLSYGVVEDNVTATTTTAG